MDLLHTAFKNLDHNRYAWLAGALACAFLVLTSCQFKSDSPFTGKPVTKDVLSAELLDAETRAEMERKKRELQVAGELKALERLFQEQIEKLITDKTIANDEAIAVLTHQKRLTEAAVASIEQKEEMVAGLRDFALSVATNINPTIGGMGTVVLGLLSTGLFADNRRKNAVIKQVTAPTPTPTP